MKAYFVRHGQAVSNATKIWNEIPNPKIVLTELGRTQAEDTRDMFSDKEFDVIYTSKFPRTKETAEIIRDGKPIPVKESPLIGEWEVGFEGKPAKMVIDYVDKDPFGEQNGESFAEVKARVDKFLEELKKESYKNVLVVTHGIVAMMIEGKIRGLNDKEIWELETGFCEVFELDL